MREKHNKGNNHLNEKLILNKINEIIKIDSYNNMYKLVSNENLSNQQILTRRDQKIPEPSLIIR